MQRISERCYERYLSIIIYLSIMKKQFFLFALVAALLCACKDKNQPASITIDPTSKTVAATGEEFVVTLKSTAAWSATADQSWVTLSPNSGQGDAFVTITVAAGEEGTANVLFSNGEGTATLVITRGGGVTPPNPGTDKGALPGEFSVSATQKVHFSQGNLQYVGTWQFAEHQWDYFGDTQSDNHRDLFGYGTGDAPNKVSNDNGDYATFTDWGTNAITNGGNTANAWRTLTNDEWVYLFCTRTNAATLFGLGSVNGVNGTILLPDNWELPAGASFTASTTQGLADQGDYYYNESGNNFSHNTYTTAQWATMEAAGAVFLPAAGRRNGSGVYGVGSYGLYWAASPFDAYLAYYLFFYSYYLNPQDYGSRSGGFGVRLVR